MTNQDLITENERLVVVLNHLEAQYKALSTQHEALGAQYFTLLTDYEFAYAELNDVLNNLALASAELNNLRAWHDAAQQVAHH